MDTLKKTDLIDALITELQLSKSEARELVELFFEHIRQNLERGEHVKLSGFGNFILRDKAERPGRNPKTKAAASIAARRVVTFKPGLKLKTSVIG